MKARMQTYQLTASNGKPIRKATMVIFEDGYVVKFIDRVPGFLAFSQAIQIRRKNESESN